MAKISVILPVYNTRKYLHRTLNSLVTQTLKDIEIICVNDGSTDGSLNVLEAYAKKDPRFIVLSQENKGASAARNLGLSMAKGEYLSILDSDDIFRPDMLEKSYYAAKGARADLVVFRANQFIEQESKYKLTDWTVKSNQIPAKMSFSVEEVLGNKFFAIQGWTWDKLFSHDFVKCNKIKFQEQRLYNDMLFTFSVYLKAKRIVFLNELLITQRKRGGGSLSDEGSKEWESLFQALLALRQVLTSKDDCAEFEQDFTNYVIRMILYHLSICSDDQKPIFLTQIRDCWDDEFTLFGRERSYYKPLSNIATLSCYFSEFCESK